MDRRAKATAHRDKAARLNAWGVGATQARYSDDGHWYATVTRFPAALFDAHGYVLFATADEYRTSPYLRIGKQISVPKPGICAMPTYSRVEEAFGVLSLDVDIHTAVVSEGDTRLVSHLQRQRNQTIVRQKKGRAHSLDCEVCGFSFGRTYGADASGYCEVHHLIPLGEAEHTSETRMEDLAILCANCHRIAHLVNPPHTLKRLKEMLGHAETAAHEPPSGADDPREHTRRVVGVATANPEGHTGIESSRTAQREALMGGDLAQTCGNCTHFDVEQEVCLELLRESGPGSRTTWKRQTLILSGPIDNLQPSEWHEQAKPQDQCHFSDDSRWAPRQREQGPDGI